MVLFKQPVSCCMILLFFLIWAPVALSQEYSIAPAPEWVHPTQIPFAENKEQQNNKNGVAYLLLDKQWRLDNREQSRYTHYASKALNTAGVEMLSQVTLNFDPSYESLTVHQVLVHRDGVTIDKLDTAQVNLIQREKELEYRIYDGSKTLNILLEDVRAGDTVEYSYSIDGANPIFSGHFAQRLDLRWQVPLARYHYRILWPNERHLFMRNHLTDKEPVERVGATHIEYIWQQSNVAELRKDPNVPSWYDPFPNVSLSDFSGWTEVGNWAWPLYKPITTTPALQEVIKSIKRTADSKEERILAALQFVQNEVRYLGIQMGVRSHKPNTPDTVLHQRFGDCKDKSRLLISLLQGMGIDAYAALVNTFSGKKVIDALPTPKSFDHVIVQVQHQGKTYWLDPTRQYQKGNLEALYQPDYTEALVIKRNNSKLEPMFDPRKIRYNFKVVEEYFDISGEANTQATYQIHNHYLQYYAESIRETLSESNLDELQQTYLNFTARYYPDVQVDKPIDVVDDQSANRITLVEQYTIPNVWRPSEDEGMMRVEFVPFLMLEILEEVKNPKRTMPYAIGHPVAFRQISRIKVPENSFFEDEFIEIKDRNFYFSRNISFKNNTLEIEYKYKSKYDHVHHNNIKRYTENINKSIGLLWYPIEKPNSETETAAPVFKIEYINWTLVLSLITILVFTFLVTWKYVYLYDPAYKKTDAVKNTVIGIGGWLIIPCVYLFGLSFAKLLQLFHFSSLFLNENWSIFLENSGIALQFIVLLELTLYPSIIVIASFLLLMFFRRRHTFPRFFIIFLITLAVLNGTETFLIFLHPGAEGHLSDKDIYGLVIGFTFIVFLISYLKLSKRVQATFTRQLKAR